MFNIISRLFTIWVLILWLSSLFFKNIYSRFYLATLQNLMITIGLVGFVFASYGHKKISEKYPFIGDPLLWIVNIVTHVVPIYYIFFIQKEIYFFKSPLELFYSILFILFIGLIYLNFVNPQDVYFFHKNAISFFHNTTNISLHFSIYFTTYLNK